MKRVWRHVLTGVSALAVGGGAIAACAHDDSTLFIRNVLAPQLVSPGQVCTYTNDPTQPAISTGKLDVAFSHHYDAQFLVGSQIVPRGNPSKPATETSYLSIQGAVVRITDAQGNELKSFTRLTSATIDPASGGAPSYAVLGTTILDQATVESPAVLGAVVTGEVKRLVSYVHFFGQTFGGQSVESGEFAFPVDVCLGCLITFSAQDVRHLCYDPPVNCYGNTATSTGATTLPVPCNPGQDFPIDCQQCPGVAECLTNPPPPPPSSASCIVDAGAG